MLPGRLAQSYPHRSVCNGGRDAPCMAQSCTARAMAEHLGVKLSSVVRYGIRHGRVAARPSRSTVANESRSTGGAMLKRIMEFLTLKWLWDRRGGRRR